MNSAEDGNIHKIETSDSEPTPATKNKWDLEDTLIEELGMGKFQYMNSILIGFVLLFSSFSCVGYIFTAADLKYRCFIPECEVENTSNYSTPWITSAIPLNMDKQLSKCSRYSPILPHSLWNASLADNCSTIVFDRTSIIECNKWVVSDEETSISSEFNIMCDREKLAFVGTMNSVGQFLGLPWAGILGDRYGRKFFLVIGCLIIASCGALRSWCNNYMLFVALECLESFFSLGVYSSGFILGLELVSSKQRPLMGIIISNFYSLGAVMVGLTMWWIRDWRFLLRVLYFPGFSFALYIWIVPESIRWLQTKGRETDVLKILSTAASVNKKPVLKKILKSKSATLLFLKDTDEDKSGNVPVAVKSAFRIAVTSKTILLRLIVCSYCWIAIIMVYYGLSMISVELETGNKYWNFVINSAIEIPAGFVSLPILQKINRRYSQFVILLFSSLGCIIFQFVPDNIAWLRLYSYTFSKFMISISANIIYIYTAEIFPTELRLSFLGLCSTAGRFGFLFASQTPLLKVYFGTYAPVLLFGIVTMSAASLILLLPETKGIKLPDTLKEIRERKK